MASNAAVTHTFVQGVASSGPDVNTNFSDLITWINTNALHLDGSKAMTGLLTLSGGPSSNLHAATKLYVDTALPLGGILVYAGSTAPSASYLLCQGQAISRATYAGLFAVIGITYGAGDGSTTFNIPDLRGRAPIGAGTGSGLSARSLGTAYGAETHSLSAVELANHNHDLSNHAHYTSGSTSTNTHDHEPTPEDGYQFVIQKVGGGIQFVTSAGGQWIQLAPVTQAEAGGGGHAHTWGNWSGGPNVNATSSTGSGTAHNIMQPSRGMNFIIKVL